MKRHLILMRHSKAESFGTVVDIERELTPIGRKKAVNFTAKLQQKGIVPDFIIHSTATRSLQTAQIIAAQLHLPDTSLKEDDNLYLSDIEHYFNVVHNLRADYINVLIVGHEPTVSQAALQFLDVENLENISSALTLRSGLSTASAAIISIKTAWKNIKPKTSKKCKIIHVDI